LKDETITLMINNGVIDGEGVMKMVEERDSNKRERDEKRKDRVFYSQAYTEAPKRIESITGTWQELINGLLGIWLVLAALVGLAGNMPTLVITGAIIAILGFWAASVRNWGWLHWLVGILGLWTIVISFLGITGDALGWTVGITGVVIAILAFWGSASEKR